MSGRFGAHRYVFALIIAGMLIWLLIGVSANRPGLSAGTDPVPGPDTPAGWDVNDTVPVCTPTPTPVPTPAPAYAGVDFGFYKSTGSTPPAGSPKYWYDFGRDASDLFDGSGTGAVWVIGYANDNGECYLNFPASMKFPLISLSEKDENERYLDYFDSKGMSVILQVEPGQANVLQVIWLVLSRYHHHPCVAGLGIDVEWLQFKDYPGGRTVTDEEAAKWYKLIKSFDKDYKLALTHWVKDKMPPTCRTGLYFLYDGMDFLSIEDMIDKYGAWSRAFPDNPVGIYLGYPHDKNWWSQYPDPYYTVANAALASAPNTRGVYWVSNTISDIYPAEKTGGL